MLLNFFFNDVNKLSLVKIITNHKFKTSCLKEGVLPEEWF